MSEKSKKIIRVIYYILVTLMLAVTAFLLMTACVGIYRTGDHPFTPEIVAAAFSGIALPVYICLGLLVVGVILHPLLPTKDEANPELDRAVVKRLSARTDLSLCPAEVASAVKKERTLRLVLRLVTLGLLAIGAVVFLLYALSFERFSMEDINGSVIAAMMVLLPCVGVPCLCGIISAFANRVSIRREIAALKAAPAEARKEAPAPAQKPVVGVIIARCVIIGLAIGFIVGGLTYEGWADVLTKAINICTECIGLG